MLFEEVFAIEQDADIGVIGDSVKFAVNGERLDSAGNELSVIWPFAKIVIQRLEEPCSLVGDHALEHTFNHVRLPPFPAQ